MICHDESHPDDIPWAIPLDGPKDVWHTMGRFRGAGMCTVMCHDERHPNDIPSVIPLDGP